MITFTGPEADIEIRVHLNALNELSEEQFAHVAQGIAAEDMRLVTPAELADSYLSVAAVDTARADEPIVGFARQVQRDFLTHDEKEDLVVGEIGSVWVDPQYRGREIGRTLIRQTTSLMKIVGFVPVAICNEFSRKNFEDQGFSPTGRLPDAPNGRQRIVEMADVTDILPLRLNDYDPATIQRMITTLPRFTQMVDVDSVVIR